MSCHGAYPGWDDKARSSTSSSRIMSAISGVSQMRFLSASVTTADAADIAAYVLNPTVAVPTPAPTPTPAPGSGPNGGALYQANCASCHGADPKNGVAKISNGANNPTVITAAFSSVTAMNSLNGKFSTAEVNAIASYIANPGVIPTAVPTPTPAPTATPTPLPPGATPTPTPAPATLGQDIYVNTTKYAGS
ncbi:MAG: cytochrome c, partial [Burkholderiales bacterium]